MRNHRLNSTYSVLLLVIVLSVGTLTACASQSGSTSESVPNSASGTAGQTDGDTTGAVKTLTAEDALTMLEDEAVVLLDVRTLDEYKSGHITGAVLLPVDEINEATVSEVVANPSTQVIVYCRSGRRSADAASKLVGLGYTDVYDLGGINSWPYDVETGSSE